MEFFADVVKTTLTGTLTIPEPIPRVTSTGSFSSHHHHATSTLHATHTATQTAGHKHHGHHGGHDSAPSLAFQHIHHTGKTALWVFFGLFTVAFIVSIGLAKRVTRNHRLFHYLTGTILLTAMASYLFMATGAGATYVPAYKSIEGVDHVLRQVFYARYIDWAITTPLLLLDLALLSGIALTTTFQAIVANEAMILIGLFAGLTRSGEKVRLVGFIISNLFFLYVLYTLVFSGRAAAKLQSDKVNKTYMFLAAWTVVLWIGYPIVFFLTEYKGLISVDAEVIIYGILDVLAKIVFGLVLLIAHSHTDGDSLVISDFWTEPRGAPAARGYGTLTQDD